MRRAVVFAALISTGAIACKDESAPAEDALGQLGEAMFFDEALSLDRNQSCASCHDESAGWAGTRVVEGSVHGRFGNRIPPSAAYVAFNPVLLWDLEEGFAGGAFRDGRATGWRLGSPLADQAQGPLLNPLEQAMPSATAVVDRVCRSDYAELFLRAWGWRACEDAGRAFDRVARSLARFERSGIVSAFTSKYDAYLAGQAKLTPTERRGLEVFQDKGRCASCHTFDTHEGVGGPLFTDFAYDNVGTPKNPDNPYYAADPTWIDPGLGGFLETLARDDAWRDQPHVTESMRALTSAELEQLAAESRGKHRVPTLRNVARQPSSGAPRAYTHNGYFHTLAGVVHFYNTRDVLPTCAALLPEAVAMAEHCWPAPEVAATVNKDDMGNLGLTDEEEAAIIAFLGTLSDGWWERSR